MKIMRAEEEDAAELLAIYAPYVRGTAITFEYEVPSLEEFRGRVRDISAKYPYLKAVGEDGSILGYAYAGKFKGRRAYDWSAEATVYIRRDARRQGTGRCLYETLEKSLRDMGVLNMNACIAVPGREETPYLTRDSVRFHEAMGFSPVGTFHDSGYKFGRWFDMVWMEKMLGPHGPGQADVRFGSWKIV